MAYNIDGKAIAANEKGYLLNTEDWSEKVAEAIANSDEIELTPKHWDVINYLRDEYFNNAGNQPNMRNMVKAMQEKWNDKKIDAKALFSLFPTGPDKQAGKIAGLPETRRKGGY